MREKLLNETEESHSELEPVQVQVEKMPKRRQKIDVQDRDSRTVYYKLLTVK